MNVLLISSDRVIKNYLPESLFNVTLYDTITAASDFIIKNQVDVILFDMDVEQKDNFNVIMQISKRDSIPIVVLVDNPDYNPGIIVQGIFQVVLKSNLDVKSLGRIIYKSSIEKEIKNRLEQLNFIKTTELLENPCDLLFNSLPTGIIVVNENKQIIYCNNLVEFHSGYKRHDLYNFFLTQVIYPDDVPVLLNEFKLMNETSTSNRDFSIRLLKRNSDFLQVQVQLSNFYSIKKESYDFLIIIKNFTEPAQTENLLLQAKKAAEESNKAKSEFLASMSHELRTPIHTIVGMAELMLDTGLNNDQKRFVSQIRFSSNALLTFINHILDYSRLETGKFNMEHLEFNLYRMMENIIDLTIEDVQFKGLELILDIETNVPELIRGDSIHLRQVLKSLINNAVKITEQGEVIIRVSKENQIDNNVILRFSVRDTLTELEKEQVNSIFNSIMDSRYMEEKKYSSTSVGLSIVKKLVEIMKGEIGIISEKGKGTEFWFTVSVQLIPELSGPSWINSMNLNVSPDLTKNNKILVFVNNPLMRTIIHKCLTCWGFSVDEAVNTDIALQKLWEKASRPNYYCLYFFDLDAVDQQTIDLLARIKTYPHYKDLKVIMMRSIGCYPVLQMEHDPDFVDKVILKPFKIKRFYEDLCEIIDVDKFSGSAAASLLHKPEEIYMPAGKTRILVVEDHDINQELFCTVLNKMGYEVVTANNGLEAVEMENIRDFNLIFMDIQMPIMNGYEATRKLRENGINTPIIAVTANIIKGEIPRCLESGMNDFLSKPFTKNDLIPILNKWLFKKPKEIKPEEKLSVKPSTEFVVFNFQQAINIFMGQEKVVLRLLGPFVERVKIQIEKMKTALIKEEYVVIQHEAHNIKGGALNIQAIEMGTRAAELEQLCKDRIHEEIRQKLILFEEAYNRFKTAAEDVLKENQ